VSHHFPKPDLNTFYFWDGNHLYERSTAALKVINHFKWNWKWLKIGHIFPRFIRDKVYDFIAKRRHRLSKGFCALPSPAQQKRFLK
jgi:predicted DCC family thiol-disulfide oxidoreductase YuxK